MRPFRTLVENRGCVRNPPSKRNVTTGTPAAFAILPVASAIGPVTPSKDRLPSAKSATLLPLRRVFRIEKTDFAPSLPLR